MTDDYFKNDLVDLHYYKFGEGPKAMLCFHGYGMHGKQFKLLESTLGSEYTFYGLDLFFHKETKLKDQSLPAIKKGITKMALAAFIAEFCNEMGIDRFSVIGYSMGTHYATIVTEEMPERVDEYIVIAPSSLEPGKLIRFFSKRKTGNKLLEKIALSDKALVNMLKLFKKLQVIDADEYKILHNEVATHDLRFNFYACFTFLRFLEMDENRLLDAIEVNNIRSIFIFGRRDRSFPPGIGDKFISRLKNPEVLVLDEGHEMIKTDFANKLTALLK
jgi:pimeloyl-ACP methyl ester carboxylesterase